MNAEITDEERVAIDELFERMERPCTGCAYEWNDWVEARARLLMEIRSSKSANKCVDGGRKL